jgi:hypothetical protein
MLTMDKVTVLNRAGWVVGLAGGILFGLGVVSGDVYLACVLLALTLFLATRVAA